MTLDVDLIDPEAVERSVGRCKGSPTCGAVEPVTELAAAVEAMMDAATASRVLCIEERFAGAGGSVAAMTVGLK